jgi:two-component system aerobic respiration control sensor histidine kinase ArcB
MDEQEYQDLILKQQQQINWLQSKFVTLTKSTDENRFVAMFNRVIELIPGYIAWKDDCGKYLGCNQDQADYLGLFSPQEIVGLTDEDLRWYEPKEVLAAVDRKVLESQLAITREVEVVTTAGEKICLLSQYAPLWIEEHQVKAMILISFDITPQKNMMRALERENSRAEAANLAKDQFITQMCHDIRTPFCGLISMVEQLAITEKNVNRKNDLQLVNASANKLLDLLNQIIDSAKAAESNVDLVPCSFSLREMLSHLEALLMPSLKNCKLFLKINIDPILENKIVAPKNSISRVLLNLLSNAIKYTEHGGITVNCRLQNSVEQKLSLVIEVVDTGIGIRGDKLEYIFDRFTQIDASKRCGIGMGLYMVKLMLDKMQGEIKVTSEVGKGSSFIFAVPLASHAVCIDNLETNKNGSSNKDELCYKNILLVEDSVIAQRAVELILDRLGADLSVVTSAAEAVQQDLNKFDLIFIDVGLPDLSGDRLAYIMREEFAVTAKIVILTAQHDFKSKSIYGDAIDIYVEKPLTYKTAVSILCSNSKARDLQA